MSTILWQFCTTRWLLLAETKSHFLLSPCSWQAWGGTENMAEPQRESTSSLQRKKPPWLRLDIPTAQMSLDEPSTFVQVFVFQSLLPFCWMCFRVCPDLSWRYCVCLLSHPAYEKTGLPPQYQHASWDDPPAVPTPGLLWHPAACFTTPAIHHSDNKEVKADRTESNSHWW